MKTINIKILRFSWIMALSLIALNATSQDVKLSRQERKEVRKAQLAANYSILDSLLSSRRFVLEADNLQNRYGDRAVVISNLNFIKVDRSIGVLQTGSNNGQGYNNMGGVTAEGTIDSWKIFKDPRRMVYRVQFSLATNIGHYDVIMVVSADNRAAATISGMWSDKLTWDGHLQNLSGKQTREDLFIYFPPSC
jgi:hypothetical protein